MLACRSAVRESEREGERGNAKGEVVGLAELLANDIVVVRIVRWTESKPIIFY
jgi:hypothetical protein